MELLIDILNQYIHKLEYFDVVSQGLTLLSNNEFITPDKLFRIRFLKVFLNQTHVWTDMKKLDDLVLYELLEEAIDISEYPGNKESLKKDITEWKKPYQ
jgi:hypothetical protein